MMMMMMKLKRVVRWDADDIKMVLRGAWALFSIDEKNRMARRVYLSRAAEHALPNTGVAQEMLGIM